MIHTKFVTKTVLVPTTREEYLMSIGGITDAKPRDIVKFLYPNKDSNYNRLLCVMLIFKWCIRRGVITIPELHELYLKDHYACSFGMTHHNFIRYYSNPENINTNF